MVLPTFPNGSVAVIVAVPRLTAVTSPAALTVATPGLLLVHVIPVPCILTGVNELVAVPSPNAPRSFSPQQSTDASGISAHVWPMPSAIARGATMPAACTGVAEFAVEPLPSWPKLLLPQQRTVPSASTAQLCSKPLDTLTAFAIPFTVTGTDENPRPGAPICP